MDWRGQYEQEGRELIRLIRDLLERRAVDYEDLTSAGLYRDLRRDPIVTTGDKWDYRILSLANFTRGHLGKHHLSHPELERVVTSIYEAVCSANQQAQYWELQDNFHCSKFVAAVFLRDLPELLRGGSMALLSEFLRWPDCLAAKALQEHGLSFESLPTTADAKADDEPHVCSFLLRAGLEAGPRRLTTLDLLRAVVGDSETKAHALLGPDRAELTSLKSGIDEPMEELELASCQLLAPTSESSNLCLVSATPPGGSGRHAPFRTGEAGERDDVTSAHQLKGWRLACVLSRCPPNDVRGIIGARALELVMEKKRPSLPSCILPG